MTALDALLKALAAELVTLCAAEGGVVLMHLARRDEIVLAASGARVAPELADPGAARAFLAGQQASCIGSARDAVRKLASRDGRSLLIGVPLARMLPFREEAQAAGVEGDLWLSVTGGSRVGTLSFPGGVVDGEQRLDGFVSMAARLAWYVHHLSSRIPEPPVHAGKGQPIRAGLNSAGTAPADLAGTLRTELGWQVRKALADNASRPIPVGRWLQDDLLLAVSAMSGEVGRRAARLAGMPESTFRRQLDKARGEAESGLAVRTEAWSAMPPLLARFVADAGMDGVAILDHARSVLLDVVTRTVGDRTAVGAALMGVTPPTYRRWLEIRPQSAAA